LTYTNNTPNHLSSEKTCLHYLENNSFPFIDKVKDELNEAPWAQTDPQGPNSERKKKKKVIA